MPLEINEYNPDRVTWRLCFYINLPFGLVAALSVLFFLSSKDGQKPGFSLPLKEKANQIDVIGLSALIPTIVCLLPALQWGGLTYHWSNARIIALLVLAAILFAVFVCIQLWQKDQATVPPSVMKQRTLWASSIYIFFLFGSFLAFVYYIPIWFQAIKGVLAVQSGIDNLPSILATVLASVVGGGCVALVGYYTWTCITSSILAAVVRT